MMYMATSNGYLSKWFILTPNSHSTVEPRYKEVGYNETLLYQGNFAGPSSLYFLVFFTLIYWETWYNKVIFMVPWTSL